MISFIMFSSSTCKFCPAQKQLLSQYESEKIPITYVVVDEPGKMAVAQEWNVSSVPTTIVVQDRNEIQRYVGQTTREQIESHGVSRNIQPNLLPEPS